MGKNLFDPSTKQEILSRIDKLTPVTERKWGKMNVNQAMRHMAFGFQMPLGEKQEPARGGTLKKKVMRWMLLNAPIPRAKAETYPSFKTVELGVNPTDFEAERTQLKSYIEKFTQAEELLEENPMGGKFSRDDWGRLMYNHTNHHLSQFGA